MTNPWTVIKDDSELDKYRVHPGQDGDGVKAGDQVSVLDKSGNLWTGTVKSEWTDKVTGERIIRMMRHLDAPQWTPRTEDPA